MRKIFWIKILLLIASMALIIFAACGQIDENASNGYDNTLFRDEHTIVNEATNGYSAEISLDVIDTSKVNDNFDVVFAQCTNQILSVGYGFVVVQLHIIRPECDCEVIDFSRRAACYHTRFRGLCDFRHKRFGG